MPLRKKLLLACALLFCLGAALALWAFVIEPGRLTVDKQTLALKGWPRELNGLKIVLVSDLHVGAPRVGADKLPKIVALINQQQPDLILLAGDFVVGGELGARAVAPEVIAAGLRDLRARLGIFAVLGNHDWWEDGPRMRLALEKNGIRVLENDAARIESNGAAFWLLGIGDLWTGKPDFAAALAKVNDDAPVLAMTHNPDVFPRSPARISLLMAGHTHGGQVWLPFIGRRVVPSQYGQRYASGHVQEGGRQLYVTNGVGTSVFPVRFLVPPEISVLTLTGNP